ncbi:extensin-like isoform X1 [Alnus glutinosa]|uniref:extensin-like isoform X1 n=1 Tax=Alnus glutinosa TaxID=3517 RepID=UPI002D77D5AA|nr:extensin-like isoform X1 [Alnus glutinosa]
MISLFSILLFLFSGLYQSPSIFFYRGWSCICFGLDLNWLYFHAMAYLSLSILMLCISIYDTSLFTLCEARSYGQMMKFSDAQLYDISSPFSLAPFESVSPASLPGNTPPFSVSAPQPPSTTTQSPISYALPPGPPPPMPDFPFQSPPSLPGSMPSPPTHSPDIPNAPEYEGSPPSSFPSPPHDGPSPLSMPSPPAYSLDVPNPPEYEGSPPSGIPSPPKNLPPSPPIFLPPVVYPPPSGPPPPGHKLKPENPAWCVAKPTVPDPIIQEAMDYACGTGADCKSIQPNGSCYRPNALLVHASYAFNSYWQSTKEGGGTCDFGGTAMLVSVDPSFDECHFVYN